MFALALLGYLCASGRANDAGDVLARCAKVHRNLHAGFSVTLERKTRAWRITGAKIAAAELKESDLAEVTELASVNALEVASPRQIPAGGLSGLAALPHLRSLTLRANTSEAGLAAVLGLRKLEALDFDGFRARDGAISPNVFGYLRDLAGLRRLKGPLPQSALQYIRHLGLLEELDVSLDSDNVAAGLSQLKDLNRLRSLAVDRFGEAGLSAIKDLPRLDHLQIGAAARLDLSALRSLTWLKIHVVDDKVGGRPGRVILPKNLRRLDVTKDTITKLDLQSSVHIEHVQFDLGVYGRFNEATDRYDKVGEVEWLSSLPRLRELAVRDPTDQNVIEIARLASLLTLTLKSEADCPDVTISDEAMRAIAKLQNLETLQIENGWGVTDSGISVLRGLRNLRRLRLTGLFPRVTAEGLAGLGNLKGLQCLDIDVSAKFPSSLAELLLSRIGAMTGLEELGLRCTITDGGLGNLTNLRNLHRLDLTGSSGYTDNGLASLMTTLPTLQEVKRDYVEGTKVSGSNKGEGTKVSGTVSRERSLPI